MKDENVPIWPFVGLIAALTALTLSGIVALHNVSGRASWSRGGYSGPVSMPASPLLYTRISNTDKTCDDEQPVGTVHCYRDESLEGGSIYYVIWSEDKQNTDNEQ